MTPPKIEEIAIQSTDYDHVIMQCSLPCEWSNSPQGIVHRPCSLWDTEKKQCKKTGIWYHVLWNDFVMVWESNDKEQARRMSEVLEDLAKRNGIQFKTCFVK